MGSGSCHLYRRLPGATNANWLWAYSIVHRGRAAGALANDHSPS
jgi:hypothetical protein